MEISLLTGVHLVITIFDKDEGKIIQYLSDSMDKFKALNQIKEVQVRKRYVKDLLKDPGVEIVNCGMGANIHGRAYKNNSDDEQAEGEQEPLDDNEGDNALNRADNGSDEKNQFKRSLFVKQKITSEIYTNDHVSKFQVYFV